MNINATLLGQTISFVIFVWCCMKYVWPPLMATIEARQKAIADGLSSAERATKDLHLAQTNAAEHIREAKQKASEIIEQANKRKVQIIDEAAVAAQLERDNILAMGRAAIEAERHRAKEELRKQVASLAIAGAERILARQIDQVANSDIVDKLVAEL